MTKENFWNVEPEPATTPTTSDRWQGARNVACWGSAGLLIIFGSAIALSPSSWTNDRVFGLVLVIGAAALLPPVLRRLRERVPVAQHAVAPVIYGVFLFPVAMLISTPFKPSANEQKRLELAAITRAHDRLARGDWKGAREELSKFRNRSASNPQLAALLTKIEAADQLAASTPASSGSTLSPAAAPAKSDSISRRSSSRPQAVEPVQNAASRYAERVETYWLPEVRSLPAAPGDDAAVGQLLTQIDGLVVNIEDGQSLSLSPAQAQSRKELIDALSSKQRTLLPAIRKRYAKALDAKLFRSDIRVSATGPAASVLKLTGGIFVRNANVDDMQTELAPVIGQMRFKRVEYRWSRYLNDGLHYDLRSPPDGEVGR